MGAFVLVLAFVVVVVSVGVAGGGVVVGDRWGVVVCWSCWSCCSWWAHGWLWVLEIGWCGIEGGKESEMYIA